MRLFERLALLAAVLLGLYWIYQQPQFRPQIDDLLNRAEVLLNLAEEQVNQNVGVGGISNGPAGKVGILVPRNKLSDWQQVGQMGKQILGTTPLNIEVDYTGSSKPDDSDLQTFKNIIGKYSGRTPTVVLSQSDLPVRDNYSLQDVVSLTKSNRSCYSSSSQVCLYVMFLPGKLEGSNALGVSYTSTALLLLPDQFKGSASAFVSRNRIAQATITHEIGHLFGLINLTYHSAYNHEDASHPGHSNNPGSVMYWAVEDLSVNTIINGGPPTTFDGYDEADIAQIKNSP